MLNHRLFFIMLAALMAVVSGCGTKASSSSMQVKKSQEASSLPTEKKRSNSLPAAAFEEEEKNPITLPTARTQTTEKAKPASYKEYVKQYLEQLNARETTRLKELELEMSLLSGEKLLLIRHVRSILARKAWQELRDEDHKTVHQFREYFHAGELTEVKVLIADSAGAENLIQKLKLDNPRLMLNFKVKYGSEPIENRHRVKQAIEAASANAVSQVDDDLKLILYSYFQFLEKIPK